VPGFVAYKRCPFCYLLFRRSPGPSFKTPLRPASRFAYFFGPCDFCRQLSPESGRIPFAEFSRLDAHRQTAPTDGNPAPKAAVSVAQDAALRSPRGPLPFSFSEPSLRRTLSCVSRRLGSICLAVLLSLSSSFPTSSPLCSH